MYEYRFYHGVELSTRLDSSFMHTFWLVRGLCRQSKLGSSVDRLMAYLRLSCLKTRERWCTSPRTSTLVAQRAALDYHTLHSMACRNIIAQ
jgi:hypothetical protein